AEVGLAIKNKAGLKRVTLELGSNSAVVIDSVEDLDEVVERCVEGSFSYSGQVCISIQRIYVNKNLYDDFIEKFIQKVETLTLGDPEEESTDISALINNDETLRIERWITDATNNGAEVLCGGSKNGEILKPTIITNTTTSMAVNSSEAFAPIVNVIPYDN